MEEALVYRKTRRGTTELAATHGALSAPSRRVLILLDGTRTLTEIAELFGAESVEHIVADLQAQGFARLADPDETSTTTQSVPVLYPRPQPVPDQAQPRGRAWVGIALLLIAGAVGGGYWFTVRAPHAANPVVQAPSTAAPEQPPITLASAERTDSTDADPQQSPSDAPQGARELPLSGLPAVTVTPTPATVVRAAAVPDEKVILAAAERTSAAAEAATPLHRAAERPAPAAPLAAPQPRPAPEPGPIEVGSSAAVSSPIAPARAVQVSVAAADPVRPERTATDLPPVVPAPSAAAPAGDPALPASAAPGAAKPPEALGEQVAALVPSTPPKSGPVQLHPRRHDPPEYPSRALRAKIPEGHVLARLWITAEGSVEQVDIVKSTPARVFDEEVKRALSTWTFDPPGRPVDTTVQLDFKP